MWIGIAIVCAVLYGIINDQITTTISPEYFSVFKRRQFGPVLEQVGLLDAPVRIQAILVGTLATWWYGLFLGIMLGISSMVGRYAPLTTRRYIHAVGGVMVFTFAISVFFGLVAYLFEPSIQPNTTDWPFLAGIRNVRSAFAIGWWHNGSYLGALIATIGASFWAQKQRMLRGKNEAV
jgi:hypothetical protein